MVGLVRFELTTSCTPCKRATRLRYSPNKEGSQSGMPRAEASAFSGPGRVVFSIADLSAPRAIPPLMIGETTAANAAKERPAGQKMPFVWPLLIAALIFLASSRSHVAAPNISHVDKLAH